MLLFLTLLSIFEVGLFFSVLETEGSESSSWDEKPLVNDAVACDRKESFDDMFEFGCVFESMKLVATWLPSSASFLEGAEGAEAPFSLSRPREVFDQMLEVFSLDRARAGKSGDATMK